MKYIDSSANLEAHCQITEAELFQYYVKVVEKNPKPSDISRSLYMTTLAINILEYIGNRMPTQAEIDCIEAHIKHHVKKNTIIDPNKFTGKLSTYCV